MEIIIPKPEKMESSQYRKLIKEIVKRLEMLDVTVIATKVEQD